MDIEAAKLLGTGSGQLILAVGLVASWMMFGTVLLIVWKKLWDGQDKLATMLRSQFDAANQRRDLWDDLEKVVEANTREIADLKRVVGEALAELRRRPA